MQAAVQATTALLLGWSVLCAPAWAQSRPNIEASVRAGISVGDGTPANDIGAAGVQLRWRLDEQWALQATLQRLTFDFERPAAVLGLRQDSSVEAIDAKAKATLFSLGLRRDHAWPGSNWAWFWSLELGTTSPKVPTVSGPLEGGGTFSIRTRSQREWVASGSLGTRYQFGPHWAAEAALQANHHQTSWRLTDSVSGRTGKVGAYQAAGLWLGLSVRF